MAIELITGYAGENHVSSADAGRFNAGICGTGKYVLKTGTKFEYTVQSSNLIRIGSGDAVDQGRHINIPQNSFEDAAIQNGNQNKTRIDVIALRYSKDSNTGIESASLVVIKGTEVASGSTPAVPSVTSGNIFNGALTDDMPLYHVRIEGTQIASVTKVFEEAPSLTSIADGVYPVGSIYMSVNSTDPADLFGGTWEQIQGKFLLACDNGHAAGSTGGEENHTLTVAEMPSHTHTGPSHTHTGPSHTHAFTTGANSVGHTHNCGNSSYNFTVAKPTSGASVGRRKVASGSAYIAMTATKETADISERTATGTQSANHTHSGTTGAAGTGNTGAAGTGATGSAGSGQAHNNMPPYLAVYMWHRTA